MGKMSHKNMPVYLVIIIFPKGEVFLNAVGARLVDKINPISLEIKKLLNDKEYLDKIVSDGCKVADEIASQKIKKIHEIVGF